MQTPKTGNVYVTVLERPINASQVQDVSFRQIVVDPWELRMEPPENPLHRIDNLILA